MSLSKRQREALFKNNPAAIDVYEKTTASRPVTVIVFRNSHPIQHAMIPASCQHQALLITARENHRQKT